MIDVDARGAALANIISGAIGNQVYGGPFKGMKLQLEGWRGNYAPYLLGTYEHELHPVIEKIIEGGYKTILNVGCGFGYYACGLGRHLPCATIYAMDNDPAALEACRTTRELNSLENVWCVKEYTAGDVDLLIMDCEGAEEGYLCGKEPYDILVELHECIKPGIANRVMNKFRETHQIQLIYNEPSYFDLHSILGVRYLFEHFDNAIATFEGRAGATPWAWMKRKPLAS